MLVGWLVGWLVGCWIFVFVLFLFFVWWFVCFFNEASTPFLFILVRSMRRKKNHLAGLEMNQKATIFSGNCVICVEVALAMYRHQ